MKKFLSMLLVVMMLLSSLPVLAENAVEWSFSSVLRSIEPEGLSSDAVGPITVPGDVDGVAVRTLPYDAFTGMPNLTGLNLPDSITLFDRGAISRLDSLTALKLPAELVVISQGNLERMAKVESLVIPAAVSYIDSAIYNNAGMKSVTFEGACPVIADGGATTLTKLAADCVIYVPDDQLDAYKAAFAACEDTVARIKSSGKKAVVPDWTIPAGDLTFDAATGTITKYTGSAARVDIPAQIDGTAVKAIGAGAFKNNYSISYVTIPEGVETLGDSAFQAVYTLSCVSLPSTLRTVGNLCFSNCTYLARVGWSEGLEEIGASAFKNGKMPRIDLPSTVRVIGDYAFAHGAAKELILGENVESIGKEAFNRNSLEKLTFLMTASPAVGENAFANNASSAALTLQDGITEDTYNTWVSLMAQQLPGCTVNQPELAPSFPALDAEAGAPFLGSWYGVAGKDVMGDFTNDYPSLAVELNADGTGTVIMDGQPVNGLWYVTEGVGIFAPLDESGAPDEASMCIVMLDENARLNFDFGFVCVVMEQEGVTYATPAVPELPWPELDLSNAKYFIGTWEAVSYVMDGETYDAALIGPMVLTLNEDGTALSAEQGSEAYPLRWYADYGTAFVGETVNTAAKITFDGAGNIEMSMNGSTVILAPKAEEVIPEPTAEPAAGPDTILGKWDDGAKTLDVYEDGRIELTYKSDGYVSKMEWEMVDGMPTVSKGIWKGCPIKTENGLLIIAKDTLYQEFTRMGEAPATIINGGQAGTAPADSAPVDTAPADSVPAGVAHVHGTMDDFIGGWICADNSAIQILLLENEANLIDGSDLFTTTWTVANGVAEFDGMKLYLQEDWSGVLDMGGELVAFERGYVEKPKASSAAPVSGDASAFLGEWTMESMAGMSAAMLEMTMVLTLNEDGTCSMFDGYETSYDVWSMENGQALVQGESLSLNAEGKLVMSADGMDMVFTKGGSAGGDELSEEEQLLALLELLGQMEGAEGGSGIPEHLQPYVGTWHMVYIATGGLEGDLRSMGLTAKLELNADGTGKLSGAADDSGKWYDDEGTVRFGQADSPLTLLDGGFLRYGSQLAGYMVFSQDETASWSPAPVATVTAAPTAAPQASVGTVDQYVGVKFTCKTYTSFGQTMDASVLGAEYGVIFHDNGVADFTMGGFTAANLPYSVTADGVYAINYFGTFFNCVPTASGFDLDYYGTMTLHLVPAE